MLATGALAWYLDVRSTRKRLLDPDFAFPSLAPTDRPHPFQPSEGLTCCGLCGGGRKHAIHTGGPWPLARRASGRPSSDSSIEASIAGDGGIGDGSE
jgi:hypothetical protein